MWRGNTSFCSIRKFQWFASLVADWKRYVFELMLIIFDMFASISACKTLLAGLPNFMLFRHV